jgi:hypothetical protein
LFFAFHRREFERSADRVFLACGLAATFVASLVGCSGKQTTVYETKTIRNALQTVAYPPRPTVPAPAFKLFHQTADSLTLVTAPDATDVQVEAILYELHDAARAHGFAALHLPQGFIDKRAPIVFFHVYRGSKCAAEKYTSGALPCGAAYHAAGEYTLGSFHDPNRDDAALLRDEDHQIELWNPDAPAAAGGPRGDRPSAGLELHYFPCRAGQFTAVRCFV